jgi:hypothetical protein
VLETLPDEEEDSKVSRISNQTGATLHRSVAGCKLLFRDDPYVNIPRWASLASPPPSQTAFPGHLRFVGRVMNPRKTDRARMCPHEERMVAQAAERGMAVAVFASTPKVARRWLDRGVGFVAVGVDTAHVLAGFRAVLAEARSR